MNREASAGRLAVSTNILKGVTVHLVREADVWGSRGFDLLRSRDGGRTWRRALKAAPRTGFGVLSRITPARRLLRLRMYRVLAIDGGIGVIAYGEGVLAYSQQGDHGFVRRSLPMNGRYPMSSGIEAVNGHLFLGEYGGNRERRPVRLFRSADWGASWDVAHEFPAGRIRHIHAVLHDPVWDCLWVTTGDLDGECRIGYSRDSGRSFEWIGGGDQTWRAVELLFTERSVFWGTDNPEGENFICQWDRGTGALSAVAPVVGPVYHCRTVTDGMLFSTAVERGEGWQDGFARVYHLDSSLHLQELLRLGKDRWHPTLFGYGVITFAEMIGGAEGAWIASHGLRDGERSIHLMWRREPS